MTETLSIFSAPSWRSPRTANYVAALIRQGDNFDYYKWLQGTREKEAQAKQVPLAFTSSELVAAEIGGSVTKYDCCGAWSNPQSALMTRTAPVPRAIYRSRYERSDRTAKVRLGRRLERVRDAWDEFQATRARDAVYGYLEAVFRNSHALQVRRRSNSLLRHAFKFANFPFDGSADPITAIIRCTCDDGADNKTISKWARALRYVMRCKVLPAQLETFMKEAGGVNACGFYAQYASRSGW